jgi:lambda family phage portal protein
MNVIDRLVGFFNPGAGLKRAVMRDNIRRYEAAGRGRRTDNWRAGSGSANIETETALSKLRNRSRDQVRNNPYAARAVQRITSNVIGTGIQPTPLSSSKLRVKRAKELWKLWGETKACDFDGQHNIYGLQRLAMRAVVESGEVIVLRRRVNQLPVPIQLQVLESDFLDTSKTYYLLDNGGWMTQGVEFDGSGKRVAYWLFDKHPGEFFSGVSRRVPADEVLHIYSKDRPGQVRGVPFGTPAMIKLRDFDEYEDAEIVRQKIAACFTAFVSDADPGGSVSTITEDFGKMEPGLIMGLPGGKQVQFAQPPVTQNYDGFSRKTLQGVAAGFGTTYESLTGDLSNVNFTSGRMGWIEAQRLYSELQELLFVPMFCDPVWKWFADAAEIGAGFRVGDLTVLWTPPRREMIDPVKETNALSAQVRNGFISWSEALRSLGYDPEQVADEMKMDFAMFDKYGFKLDCDGRVQAAQANDNAEPPEENGEDQKAQKKSA